MSGENKSNHADTKIVIQEYKGVDRINEPITVGIPFPMGQINNLSTLNLVNPEQGLEQFQATALAEWPDKSIKWCLFDFQADIGANQTCEWSVQQTENCLNTDPNAGINAETYEKTILVDTGAAVFILSRQTFKPFISVKVSGYEMVDFTKSNIIFTNQNQAGSEPVIEKMVWETDGTLRKTLKIEGYFPNKLDNARPVEFTSRISFFIKKTFVKIEFTLLNPNAAKHPGGIWDLGDPGSVLFSDLSLRVALKKENNPAVVECFINEDSTDGSNEIFKKENIERFHGTHLNLYQDSSGGDNWNCHNHVNRNNEVKHTFRGYKLHSKEKVLLKGKRAVPVISLRAKEMKITGAIKNFWQNFPKALEGKDNSLIFKLFPEEYSDLFELQGGEQKTHTIFIGFDSSGSDTSLDWIDYPLIAGATPQAYAQTGVFPYLVPDSEMRETDLLDLVNSAIDRNTSFFKRREIIDEYGWRNFGELYADHEAAEHDENEMPFISHYNNQYDCINGFFSRYAASGDARWFVLADQLTHHVKDIDIYHTGDDKPEFNKGLFWHTNHYMEAKTSTHRCFSKKQVKPLTLSNYGGGPALSHCYTTGLLNHYYMTGDNTSKYAVLDLASFIRNNLKMDNTLTSKVLKKLKKIKNAVSKTSKDRVQLGKIYGLDGPGRSSGNALNVLLDAYYLTKDMKYLQSAEHLILNCIHPHDVIEKRDLLDTENRWMYTIFLQAIGKYLALKSVSVQYDFMWGYARNSLLNYGMWMVENELPYLDAPYKLDYPNETWATQEFRKSFILFTCTKYSKDDLQKEKFKERAVFFSKAAFKYLFSYKTANLIRPIILTLQNGFAKNFFDLHGELDINKSAIESKQLQYSRLFYWLKKIGKINLINEYNYLKWRI